MRVPKKEIQNAAALLGRKGGKVRSEAKAKAAKQNGSKGGRGKVPLIAACRCGEACRFHGRAVHSPNIESQLPILPHKEVCPELAAGFGCPRPAMRVQNGRAVMNGKDVTARIETTCEALAAKFAGKVDYYVGVNGSPTCDPKRGIFAQALAAHGIPTLRQLRKAKRK